MDQWFWNGAQWIVGRGGGRRSGGHRRAATHPQARNLMATFPPPASPSPPPGTASHQPPPPPPPPPGHHGPPRRGMPPPPVWGGGGPGGPGGPDDGPPPPPVVVAPPPPPPPPPNGGGGDDQPKYNLWLVDVTAFGTFAEGMQVQNEQMVAQDDQDKLQQKQQNEITPILPCVLPKGSGRVSVILPDGKKPSDGSGWGSSQQPCPANPQGGTLEPVGVADQQAAAGYAYPPWIQIPPYAMQPSRTYVVPYYQPGLYGAPPPYGYGYEYYYR